MDAEHQHTPVSATVSIRLAVHAGHARVPDPTAQYGGIAPVRPGSLAMVDVGPAQRIAEHDARLLAGALARASYVDILGHDADHLPSIRSAIAVALDQERGRVE